jgi:DNA-binding transcriptional LysR family regulator
MNLKDIEAFIALAEAGSINRAALHLNLTQPATTRRVQNFEAAIGGAALLDRSVKPPILTPAGSQVLEHCRRVLKAVAELGASASAAGQPTGDLRIGIAHGLGEVVLGSPLEDLRRRFPSVRLRVSSNWTTRLIEDVRNGALDCAIGFVTKDHAVPPDMHAAAVGSERVVVVAARNAKFRAKYGDRLFLRDIAGQVWVLNPPGCGCRAALQRAFDRARASMQVAAEVFGEDLQLAFIARSGGLGLVPQRQLDGNPHRKRLRIVNVADFDLQVTITMLHGPSLGSLAAAVEHLRARIAAGLNDHR